MSLALHINQVAVVTGIVTAFVLVCLARPAKDSISSVVPKWMLVLAYGLILSVLFIAALMLLGLPAFTVPFYASLVHGVLTGVLILVFLQIRFRRMDHERVRIAIDLERTRSHLDQEKAIREDQARLLAMLGHELKTPLAVVQMLVDGASVFNDQKKARAAVRDMNTVIERTIQANQLDDQQLKLHLETCDISAEILKAIARCPHPDRIVADVEPERLARTDIYLLNVILMNLLENACKYGAPGRAIHLRLQFDERTLCVRVMNPPGDSGWPDPDKVFQKYYRSKNASRCTGSGLGLYLVAGFARALGGEVRYEPTSQLIVFTFEMPVFVEDDAIDFQAL